ncbi:uncharacterized protein PG998_011911 [Apiospora kogelbergensis]|uniref:uncharacterized protein n=1 Tax=Apiospora kogelbergensis TaxID=1337665 RepID=UPI00312CF323
MSFLQAWVPALKGIAIAGSLINGGIITSGCRLLPSVYPAVSKSAKDGAKQWGYFYWCMSATVPWVDLTTIIAIGTLAYAEYREDRDGLPWKIWVRKVMLVLSNQLLAIAAPKASEAEPLNKNSKKTLDIMKEFNAQMSFRMMFPWVVGGLALWASLGF